MPAIMLQMPEGWDDVRVNIRRPSQPDPDGRCGNRIPQDDYLSATLSRGEFSRVCKNITVSFIYVSFFYIVMVNFF